MLQRNFSYFPNLDFNVLNWSFVLTNGHVANAFDFESLSGQTDGFSFKLMNYFNGFHTAALF